MALAKCRECGHEVAVGCEKCPKCGCADPWVSKEKFDSANNITAVLSIVVGVLFLIAIVSWAIALNM